MGVYKAAQAVANPVLESDPNKKSPDFNPGNFDNVDLLFSRSTKGNAVAEKGQKSPAANGVVDDPSTYSAAQASLAKESVHSDPAENDFLPPFPRNQKGTEEGYAVENNTQANGATDDLSAYVTAQAVAKTAIESDMTETTPGFNPHDFDDNELLFGSSSKWNTPAAKGRLSAVMKRRVSELTRSMASDMPEAGDKENLMSLLMDEPDLTEDVFDL